MNRGLYGVIAALKKFRAFVDNVDVPAQHVQLFLTVASRGEMPLAELVNLVGTTQSAVSRAAIKLAQGPNPGEPGYNLLSLYEDPYYRRRKLVDLTPRGNLLLRELEKATTEGSAS